MPAGALRTGFGVAVTVGAGAAVAIGVAVGSGVTSGAGASRRTALANTGVSGFGSNANTPGCG